MTFKCVDFIQISCKDVLYAEEVEIIEGTNMQHPTLNLCKDPHLMPAVRATNSALRYSHGYTFNFQNVVKLGLYRFLYTLVQLAKPTQNTKLIGLGFVDSHWMSCSAS